MTGGPRPAPRQPESTTDLHAIVSFCLRCYTLYGRPPRVTPERVRNAYAGLHVPRNALRAIRAAAVALNYMEPPQ